MTSNKTLLFFAFIFTTFASAQVGIGTQNPQGIFNIDGAKDNAATGVPTAAQQLNDFTVLANGNVGIGTTAPSQKLEIISPATDILTGGMTARIFNPATAAANNFAGVQFKSSPGNSSWKIGANQDTATGIDQSFYFLNSFNGASFAPKMMIASNTGNVGIGTTAPATKLHVAESINNAAFQGVVTVDANPATLAANGFNNLNPDVAKMSSGIQFKGWNGKNEGGIFRQTGSADKSHMLFTVNTTNDVAMVINENRNIGIGTTAPSSILDINSTSGSIINTRYTTTTDIGSNLILQKSKNATNLGNGAVTNGEIIGRLVWKSNNGSGYNANSSSEIRAEQVGNASTTNNGSRLVFATTLSGNTAFQDRMTITDNGNVGIGTTAPTSKLEVNGAATNTVALNAAAATTIDFALSNLAYTSATANTITLSNLKDGGAYSLVFTSTAVNTAVTFSATGFTFKYMGTGARTTGKAHIYSFIVAGTVVYVSMSTEN